VTIKTAAIALLNFPFWRFAVAASEYHDPIEDDRGNAYCPRHRDLPAWPCRNRVDADAAVEVFEAPVRRWLDLPPTGPAA
jgi:hypothetical protein